MQQLVSSQDTHQRKAAYVVLGVMAEIATDQIQEQNLEELMNCVFAGIRDPQSLVRLHAVRALTDFAFNLTP